MSKAQKMKYLGLGFFGIVFFPLGCFFLGYMYAQYIARKRNRMVLSPNPADMGELPTEDTGGITIV